MNKVFISCKESRIENNKSFYGSFYLGPFNEGESLTIANALRRTLLSECPGLAIISVLIEDVNHEYSTLSGVRDSVLDILLNLKEIVLKKSKNPWLNYKPNGVCSVYNQVGSSFFKPVVGYLKVKGPGIVRAKDLRLPPFIQCVDPDQYIATLSENGSLNMKFVIMEGKSYIIQKAKDFVDYSLVKKRRLLLKQLKDLMMSRLAVSPSTCPMAPSNGTLGHSIDLKEAVNYELFHSRLAYSKYSRDGKDAQLHGVSAAEGGLASGLIRPLPCHGTFRAKSLAPSLKAPMKGSSKPKPFTAPLSKGTFPIGNAFKNASALNIDAVFSPIKKVNYIIEVSDNKIVNLNYHDKYSFMTYISTLIESGYFYKKNFPFLTTAFSPYYNAQNALKEKKFMQDLMQYVETYSTEELWSSSRSLHPLRKEGALHTVILEIWTNGSLHPREALSMAFSHLTELFMNLEKTKVFNPIYKDVSSYKKCLNTLPTL
uniref:Plastid-encoded RNA polymerase subunit alpha n=1 Tax=Hyalogonium fusiforme TaxID=2926373 RepID=A0A9E8ADT1_9CHLO|nr:RNA polymerase alpha subunit [Hyalogonium fusiforme]